MQQSDEIYDLSIPMFSYKVFSKDELQVTGLESLGDLNRYDYFDFSKMDTDESAILDELLYEHYEEIRKKGFEYKDFITNRYFFKQFVVRDRADPKSNDEIAYKKYTISDWNEEDKNNRYDTRVLTIDMYWIKGYEIMINNYLSFKIKIAHKDEILDALKNYDKTSSINFYMLPVYIFDDLDEEYPSYKRISDFEKKIGERGIYMYIAMLRLSLSEFCGLNLRMIEATENNEPVDFLENGNRINKGIVDYIKEHPTQDKKITIDMGKGAKLRIKPSNKNVYSHNNTILRRLCDYKYQVSAHYQRYWVGSRTSPERKRVWKWKEAYYKNEDKPFRIIKERVNLEEVGN